MGFFQLFPESYFVATYYNGEPDHVLIINIATGEAIKIRNPIHHHSVLCLVHFLKNKGIPTDDGVYYRALLKAYDLKEELCEPKPNERNRTYEMVDNFLRPYYFMHLSTMSLNKYFLKEDNIFAVSYGPEDHELIVTNTLDGKSLKIESADTYDVTEPLTVFMQNKGVCNDDNNLCLAIGTGDFFLEKLGKPVSTDGKRIYRKLNTFLSKLT
jgi:hypothetical protein